MDILAELENFKSQYAAANSLFEEASAQANEAKAVIAAKDEKIAALELDKMIAAEQTVAAVSALEAKKAELENAVAELTELKAELAALKASTKTAEDKAIEMAAAQGIPAPKIDVAQASAALTKEEALAQYGAIRNPVERGQFYLKHRDLLLG